MPLRAATTTSESTSIFLLLAAMIVAAKLLGELSDRLGQPVVLGELLAGVLLGPSLLGIMPAGPGMTTDLVALLAELGVVLLLFEVGLETDLAALLKVGGAALSVAAVGVVLPFLGGWLFWRLTPHPDAAGTTMVTAIFLGATLTATSVGITARVLRDLGRLQTTEARVILGAAVIDDLVGLVILSVVAVLAEGGGISAGGVARTLGLAVAFLFLAVAGGRIIGPRAFDLVGRMQSGGVIPVTALAVVLAFAALAALAGSAMIVGAFAAGLSLAATRQHKEIERVMNPIVAVFAPLFFVQVGSALDLRVLDPRTPGGVALLVSAAALIVIALAGKVIAGWSAPWTSFDRLTVGLGMIPRGEVGLIFADLGRRAGVLSSELFAAVVLVVMATTFFAPIALKLRLQHQVAALP